MKIALLGVGRIGTMHAGILARTPGVDELVIADVDAERARSTAATHGATAAAGIDEAIEAADAVVIAAGTDAHARLIDTAIAAGPPDVLREAARGLARGDDRARGADRGLRRALPARVPATVRPGLPRDAPAGRER